MDGLIYVSKGHIPNLVPLEPLLHVEKFVVVVVGGCVDLGPLPTSGPIKGDSRTKFKTFFERKKNMILKICLINHQLNSVIICYFVFSIKVFFICIDTSHIDTIHFHSYSLEF